MSTIFCPQKKYFGFNHHSSSSSPRVCGILLNIVILGFYHSYFLRYHVYKYVDSSPPGVINMVTMATVTLKNMFYVSGTIP